jgi:general L-amino acid transport system permease protein
MTTGSEATNPDSLSEAPPIVEVGVFGWIRTNLFGSATSTVLTFVSVALAYLALRTLITFVFFEADWRVVSQNLVLYAIGQYPREEAWRTATSLGLVVILAGASFLMWGRYQIARRVLIVLWILSPATIVILLTGFKGSTVLPFVRTQLWSGLLLTIMLTVVGITASFPLGVLLALGRRGDMPVIKTLSTLYIEVVRGVPLITVLFMAQVMLPLFTGAANLDVVIRAMAGITIFSAAYVAENVRGGLQAIPKGQIEAAQALGLNPVLVTALIVMPQAIRIVIPALVGQFISLFKDTTLVSIITLLDLLGISKAAIAQNPEFLSHKVEVYIFLALIYFVFSYLMSTAARRIEEQTRAMGGTRRL